MERALHTFIQQGKENGAYIKLLCNWLRYAANLPTFSIEHPSRKNWLPISDYWLELLSRAIKDKEVFSLPLNDVKEFYDHLIENLEDVGSIYAYAALSALRKVITAQTQGLGISTAYAFVGSGVTYQPNEAAKAATALVAAIAAKHTDKPQRKDFITNAEYLRASLAWTATQINTKNQKEVEAKADAKALKENE